MSSNVPNDETIESFHELENDGSEIFEGSASDFLKKMLESSKEYGENRQTLPSDSSLETRQRGFHGLMSFAGTLPEDFDYRQKLDEAKKERLNAVK